MKFSFPLSTFCLSLITLIASTSLAFHLHGNFLSTVSIQELREYGGLDFNHLFNGEIWRLVTAQFVHVKQLHMLFNVLSLALLGISLEPIIGRIKTLLLWFVSGSLGLIASVYFGEIPYEVGTGASQAILGFVAVNCIIIYRKYNYPEWAKLVLFVSVVVPVFLDLVSVHYPKAGHVVGFTVGLIVGYFVVPPKENA